MNFDLAADMLREEKIEVASVLTDDDVAVENSTWTAGRRGVGLTVLMEKLLGAAAEKGADLAHLKTLGDSIRATGRSMGMALSACTVPHAGKPSFELGENEMEVGVGIHGEPGRKRVALAPADEITEMLMEPILSDLPFKQGDNVILFVNGMGGTPLIELYVVYNEMAKIFKGRNIKIARSLVGSYITSLDMAGCSITLVKLDDELISLWDAPVKTAGLRWGI
jgi:dihydroxyacetone kinase-like protein